MYKRQAISKEKAQENSGEAEAVTDNVIMYEFLSELKDIADRPNGITLSLIHISPRPSIPAPSMRKRPSRTCLSI